MSPDLTPDPYTEPLHVGYPTAEAQASVDAAIASTSPDHPDSAKLNPAPHAHTARKLTAQTLAYFPPDVEGMHIEAFPKLNGWGCMRWSASDVFEERDAAFKILAMIAENRISSYDADDAARQFFKDQGDQPWNYVDDEEEDSDDEAAALTQATAKP